MGLLPQISGMSTSIFGTSTACQRHRGFPGSGSFTGKSESQAKCGAQPPQADASQKMQQSFAISIELARGFERHCTKSHTSERGPELDKTCLIKAALAPCLPGASQV